jgi:hypothetical protein
MDFSTTRGATSCETTREIPIISRSPQLYYRIHKSSPPVPILSHNNLVNTTSSYLCTIHRNVIHLPTSLFPVVSPLLAFPSITYTHSFPPHSCYMPYQSIPATHHYNFTWRRAQITQPFVIQLSPPSHHFSPLRSKHSPQHPVLKTPQSIFLR